ncbi:MAG: DSD1 family PLP-dependent enzyme [Planctomycetota bacterium]|nr:DSD1 family PLP-dependent enzyme [Planctomycetota bacterium]
MPTPDPRFDSLPTPALILDEARMRRNIARLERHVTGLGATLRPHLKTVKSVDVARVLLAGGNGPATVSTLAEAEVFAAAGMKDLAYAVGIAPQKLARVAAIRAAGCDLVVVLDNPEAARAVAAHSRACGQSIPALIELDCDGHRSGVDPAGTEPVELGRLLVDGGAELRGVLTHAGGSYAVTGREAHAAFAERERLAAVTAATSLRTAGLPCPVVSIGSSPTAHAARDLTGITEVRAGVYVFFDLVQAGLGVCTLDDLALSALTSVIGHQREKGWAIIDAGWTALSQDRGTAQLSVDQGYGLVCDEAGRVLDDLIVVDVNQEHGIVASRPGSDRALPELPLGTRLRILPNHACAMAAMFERYHVVPVDERAPLKVWPRFGGW